MFSFRVNEYGIGNDYEAGSEPMLHAGFGIRLKYGRAVGIGFNSINGLYKWDMYSNVYPRISFSVQINDYSITNAPDIFSDPMFHVGIGISLKHGRAVGYRLQQHRRPLQVE